MRLCDAGWVWEGQGLDPGVHPSIFGVGEGAEFFGLTRCHFLFHPTTDLALKKLSHLDEVVCDISKWYHCDVGETGHGSRSYVENSLENICSEAEALGRFSLKYPNVTGAIHDDMLGLLRRIKATAEDYDAVYEAVKRHNPELKLWSVVYVHELEEEAWDGLAKYMDVINLWTWQGDEDLDTALARCAERFPGKPICVGCYLRRYVKKRPVPLDFLRNRFENLVRWLDQGRIAGYSILGTVLIDGQLEQAEFVRDFIAQHS